MINAVKETFGSLESSYSVSSSRSSRFHDDSSSVESGPRSRSRTPSFTIKEDTLPAADSLPETDQESVTLFPKVKYLVPQSSVVPDLLSVLALLSDSDAPLRGELPRPEPTRQQETAKTDASSPFKRKCIEESKE